MLEIKSRIKNDNILILFQQLALTKNPKKRPTADKLLIHPFVAPDLPKSLAVELLQKAHSPQQSFPAELEVSKIKKLIFNLQIIILNLNKDMNEDIITFFLAFLK